MPDGSTCKQNAFCKKTGSIITNDQCGGATSVIILYPTQYTGIGKYRDSCHFNFHSIEFSCNTARPTIPIKTTTLSSVETKTITKEETSTTRITSVHKVTSTMPKETSLTAPDDCNFDWPAPTPTLPSHSMPIKETSLTITKFKTNFYTTTKTSLAPAATVIYPNILPACLKTWLYVIGCKSNVDTACFCPSIQFSAVFYSCIAAHAASMNELKSAQMYYQAICVSYISVNPGIIIDVPSLALPANNSSLITSGSHTKTISYPPVTVIKISTTLLITKTAKIDHSTSTNQLTLTTTLTIPKVIFTTLVQSSGSKSEVYLIPNTAIPTDTKYQTGSSTTKDPIPTNIWINDGNKDVAALCVVAAAFLFAMAIVL